MVVATGHDGWCCRDWLKGGVTTPPSILMVPPPVGMPAYHPHPRIHCITSVTHVQPVLDASAVSAHNSLQAVLYSSYNHLHTQLLCPFNPIYTSITRTACLAWRSHLSSLCLMRASSAASPCAASGCTAACRWPLGSLASRTSSLASTAWHDKWVCCRTWYV